MQSWLTPGSRRRSSMPIASTSLSKGTSLNTPKSQCSTFVYLTWNNTSWTTAQLTSQRWTSSEKESYCLETLLPKYSSKILWPSLERSNSKNKRREMWMKWPWSKSFTAWSTKSTSPGRKKLASTMEIASSFCSPTSIKTTWSPGLYLRIPERQLESYLSTSLANQTSQSTK